MGIGDAVCPRPHPGLVNIPVLTGFEDSRFDSVEDYIKCRDRVVVRGMSSVEVDFFG